MHTDASIDAILMQLDPDDLKFHPVYYASGKTTPAEAKYTSYELEVLAKIRALVKFREYLLGIPFTIVTDCKAFAMTMKKKDLCLRVARWALLLGDFKYQMCHRPGKNMQHVDGLSRNPLSSIMFVTESEDGLIARLRSAQEKDNGVSKLLGAVACSQAEGYILRNNILYKCCKDVGQAHKRRHFGVIKTEAIVKQDFWFKGLREKVDYVIANCRIFIIAERKLDKQDYIDYVSPMTATKQKYAHIFVIADAFTTFTRLHPTKSTDTAEILDEEASCCVWKSSKNRF